MSVDGISHVTFLSTDLERTATLLCEGLGAKEIYDSAGRNFSITREKFFLLGGVWIAVMEGEPVGRSYRHVAFKVDEADLPALEARLRSLGAEIRPSRPRVEGEGQSLYFYDFDDNLFELHAGTLEQRLQRYGRRVPARDGPSRRNEGPLSRRTAMPGLETHYSASDIEARILAGLRAAGLDPGRRLTPEELGPLDHFHTGGLRASRELLDVAQVRSHEKVLDIGAGLAGSARLIASVAGCRVDCIEMSPDYCAGAALLNRLTGLEERIGVHPGSALDLPFPDDSFDVAWMQNVGMNIADKRGLYREIARVLKPGGRFAFQELAAGKGAVTHFPLPWATDPAHSFLVDVAEMRSLLADSGFTAELFEDTSDAHLGRTAANATPAAPGQLGLGVFVDNLALKAANARRSLEEGQVRLVRGVFRAN